MSPFRRVWARYRGHIAPAPGDTERLRARLAAAEVRDPALRRLAAPDPGAEARVRSRLRATLYAPTRRPLRGIVALLAAFAVVALIPWSARPRPLAETLHAEAPVTHALTARVALAYTGEGEVSGTDRAPRITWAHGTLSAEVEPDQGVSLVVETPEARVEVVGTVFAVVRDVFGTAVSVQRGRVAVWCGGEPAATLLAAGDAHSCLPVRPAALLARARALAEGRAPPAEVLATLDRALAVPAEDAMRHELAALRVATLLDAGRDDDARTAAARLLSDGAGARHAEVARIAARLALRQEGCPAALALLDGVPPDERIATDEIARADCLAPTDPAAARAALHAALARSPTDSLTTRIHARLDALAPSDGPPPRLPEPP